MQGLHDGDQQVEPLGLGARFEQALLERLAKVDGHRQPERQRTRAVGHARVVDAHEPHHGAEEVLGQGGGELLRRHGQVDVVEELDLAAQVVGLGVVGGEELAHGEALAARDDDVEAAVVELVDDVVDRRRATLAREGVVVVQHDAEDVAARAARGDQRLVALLEDVQRQDLAGQQHERQRKQPDGALRAGHATPVR